MARIRKRSVQDPEERALAQIRRRPRGTYAAALERVMQNALQLHEHRGPYYERWLAAMRRRFGAPPGP